MGSSRTLKNHSNTSLVVPKNGYVFVFCSNESPHSSRFAGVVDKLLASFSIKFIANQSDITISSTSTGTLKLSYGGRKLYQPSSVEFGKPKTQKK